LRHTRALETKTTRIQQLVHKNSNIYTETKGGIESTLLGFSTSIGPILLFVGILGSSSLGAAYWATLITATVVPALCLLLKGHPAVLCSTRTASLSTYIALVLQLAMVTGGPFTPGAALSTQQLLFGLAAGSLTFAMASGLILLAGLLRLGNIFKMIPSTVTAGIGNGTALLLVWLAVQQVARHSLSTALIAGVMLLCFLLWPTVQARIRPLRHVPTTVLALSLGLALGLNTGPGLPVSAAPMTFDTAWVALQLWPLLMDQHFGHLLIVALPGAVALALVMILESATAIGVMEMRFGLHIDANRQLVVLGASNVAGAMLGGVPCTGSPLRSVANGAVGGRGVLAAVISLVTTGAVVLAGGSLLLALPSGVVAGLFLLQVPLMIDRPFAQRLVEMLRTRRLHRHGTADLGFWITLVISLAGFFGSLIWACFLGIGLSALAVLRQVSNKLTAQWVYLDRYRSRRVRSAGEVANLARQFHRVGVLRLTGHLFFGNSARLSQLIDELHGDAVAVVIDVSQVHDVDPSGLSALTWIVRALLDRRLTVVVTGLQRTQSPELSETLTQLIGVKHHIDLDYGLEHCEELMLQNATVQAASLLSVPLAKNSLLADLSDDDITTVLMLGEHREVAKGQALFLRDDLADGVWLLEVGAVSILAGWTETDAGASRLATFGPGQFVGEMGYVDGKVRSATARADTPVRAMLLDKASIAALIERQPGIALTITRNIARELSHRVRSTSAMLTDEGGDTPSEWANSSLSSFSRL
jgi:MFS superfamily sulfate permease-like transporter